ncbi:hypothetical protein OURE66S_02076 [Oligella ureolytica]
MNKRKIQIQFAFALALGCASTAVFAQYIPLTDLPEVPTQINESGQLVTPHAQRGANPLLINSVWMSLTVSISMPFNKLKAMHPTAKFTPRLLIR